MRRVRRIENLNMSSFNWLANSNRFGRFKAPFVLSCQISVPLWSTRQASSPSHPHNETEKAHGNGVKWVQDKAFQKSRGILLKLVTNCQEFHPLSFSFSISYSHRPVILTKEELDKSIIGTFAWWKMPF